MMKQCEYEPCGQTFEAQRSDARYCSATCRSSASRDRRKEESASDAVSPAAPMRVREVEATPPTTPEPMSSSLLETMVESLVERVDELEDRVFDARFEAARGRQGLSKAQQGALEGLQERLAAFEERLDDLVERVETVERIASEEQDVDVLAKQVSSQSVRLGRVEADLGRAVEVVKDLREELTALDEAMASAVTLLAEVA